MKAIETSYKGYRFRSRLEARWAVFLDAIGAKWEYEPEGYQLPSGWYLPDFFIHYRDDQPERIRHPGAGAFLEIKPIAPTEIEKRLMVELSRATFHNGILAVGLPGDEFLYQTHYARDHCTVYRPHVFDDVERDTIYSMSSVFGRCARHGDGFWVPHEASAINAARAARFERRQ